MSIAIVSGLPFLSGHSCACIHGFSSLLQVSASDDDGPVNSAITYSLVGGNQLGHFTINPKKGKLQVAKALDWEQVSLVQAEQKCGPMAGPEGKRQTHPILMSRESPG